MKFTLSWLKEHLETDAPLEAITDRLTMLGLEVEGVTDLRSTLAPFTVAEVLTAEKHPDADKLRLCTVRTGTEGEADLQIICGAPNARAGIKVVLARPGTTIPESGQVLKVGKIRGVESRGMMCSSRELGLGDDHSGIIELPADTPLGVSITEVLPLDPMIDIAITPNRPDCLGVRGVARDLAASGLGTLKPLTIEPVPGTFDSPVRVTLGPDEADRDACPQYVARYIRGVKNGESPQWVKDRLTAIGLRPISALVDVTNLITYEYGRPLHVFDADKLTGDIQPRLATAGATIAALDDKDYTLSAEDVAICDDAGPQGIGGIMGGRDTGCTAETVNVVLESALFDPRRIAATGRRLGIDSDARYRFDRGVDPESAIPGTEAATRLILDWCGGEASHLVVAGAPPAWRTEISLDPLQVLRLCGLRLDTAQCRRILEALGCEVLAEDAYGVLTVLRPSWRPDISDEHDLVEEVARIHGFNRIPRISLPRDPMPTPVLTGAQVRRVAARRALAARGLSESVTWSFQPKAHAEAFGGGLPALDLANPISSDLDAMRPSILPNLATAAQRNADRGVPNAALFEVGPQFHGGEPGEQQMVAAGVRVGQSGPRHWDTHPRTVDAYDAKADALAALTAAGAPVGNLQTVAEAPAWYHPGRSGTLKLGPKVLARFGELHPGVLKTLDVKGPVAAFEVFLEAVPEPKAKPTKARPLLNASPFQPVERDFAFLVNADVSAETLVRAAKGADKALIADVAVFDVYQGERLEPGKTSVALCVTLQPTERTLTDEDIEAVTKKIVAAVVKATGGELRA
ncbi:phenylalanine--tRNA ligase subunit beta [Roseospira marina]|uniref:Phenylalanine--tRNA ligase beta subunit n=1 Tax=Roseospira marina TaxID=140057 RepID=A0A5M6I7U4_9PROT|nr:phenylalanine--tRNA ligase subunit beta [Roseospira marina]KAA5604212.1 phenylalanine--tRNA ligase subunit beta [Roseospira marina]MBB4315690.1 phenylalanyl-tRNA synthetase beta chain [Roseospira marina]MBB5088802.1 phenylalanyl-tRNA synthetase beta chain [Roseospira marina]